MTFSQTNIKMEQQSNKAEDIFERSTPEAPAGSAAAMAAAASKASHIGTFSCLL